MMCLVIMLNRDRDDEFQGKEAATLSVRAALAALEDGVAAEREKRETSAVAEVPLKLYHTITYIHWHIVSEGSCSSVLIDVYEQPKTRLIRRRMIR